jgi:anti-sigma B factor antagonist
MRIATAWYKYQDLLLTRNELWVDFRALRRKHKLAPLAFEPGERALYSFALNETPARMVCRRPITGAGEPDIIGLWTEALPEAAVLHVEGEVDLATAPHFARALHTACRKYDRLIVDLTRLRYLDGSGVKVLLEAVDLEGKRFVLVGSSPTVHRVLDILRVGDMMPIVATLDDAREHFRKRRPT